MTNEELEELNRLLEEFPPENDEVVLAEAEEDARIKAKKERDAKLAEMTVKQYSIEYNADMVAQSNMGDAGTLANWMFNKTIVDTLAAVASAPDATNELKYIAGLFGQVYEGVYKENKVGWKGADDKMHEVEAESILKALHQTMLKKGEIIGGEE